ncbi:RNA polymerase sigma factor [Pedobacter sp. GR22-6]|uniref:RNA polymerase sigma factor n=1 Tax=Pedobacter sp. GR22-6 TaxID=3127957 RepID=UPI00307F8911
MKILPVSDEKELLRKLRDGEENAFNQLYQIYARRLASKLIYLLKSEELAQDVLQDVFMKIWSSREMIDPELSFSALLSKMATNLSKNVFRKNLYDQSLRNLMDPEASYNPIADADDAAQAKTLLEMALGRLTERQRDIYILHKIDGRSYQEISEQLNISVSAINHHLQKANKQLKTILKSQSVQILIALLPVFLKK